MAPEETTNKATSVREKLWKYAEGPWFWGGVALIIGAAVADKNLAVIFVIGYVPISIGVFRANFFYGRTKGRKIIGYSALLLSAALLLFVAWKIIPKPQPPLTKDDLRSMYPTTVPTSKPESVTSSPSSQVATKDDIRTLLQRVGQLQNRPSADTQQAPTSTDMGKVSSTPSTPTQTPVPVEAQLQPLKTLALTLADEINKWADQRLKEAPETFPASTPDERNKEEAFHDQIVSEWRDRYGMMSGATLNQLYLVWRNVLKIPVPSVRACMLENVVGHGDRGILETKKLCAGFIKQAAEKIN
jgi:hypothetical protein